MFITTCDLQNAVAKIERPFNYRFYRSQIFFSRFLYTVAYTLVAQMSVVLLRNKDESTDLLRKSYR